jgi:CRP/FNR family transcriptional regulator
MTTTLAELKQIGIANALRSCQLFAGISIPELDAIANITAVKSVPKGSYLFHEGDPSLGFYIVQTGAINVHRVSATGKEQVIHVFRAGESFAEATLATEQGVSRRCARGRSVAGAAGAEGRVSRAAQAAAGTRLAHARSMSIHLRVLVGQLEDLTLKDVETRLANWLVKTLPRSTSQRQANIELSMTKRCAGSGTRHRERDVLAHARQVSPAGPR